MEEFDKNEELKICIKLYISIRFIPNQLNSDGYILVAVCMCVLY